MKSYDDSFFTQIREGARSSAQAIVPLVMELVQPGSVIDIGCGDGTWLAAFRRQGVTRALGVDGDYVDRSHLAIPSELFRAHDLRRPFELEGERFDLAVSLEVGEHLPADCAEAFVQSLTRLAPVVLFSAAIPHQRGTHHVNEQWPTYWIERFAALGYQVVDCLRQRVWNDNSVDWWYAQNMFLFVEPGQLAKLPALARAHATNPPLPAALVHPRAYLTWVEECSTQKNWAQRMYRVAQDLAPFVPRGGTFILIDDTQFEPWAVPDGRQALPFLERGGQYWGPPGDDRIAIAEFERMRGNGASLLAIGWPSFWWLEFFREFVAHLRARYRCVVDNDRVLAFDLTQPASPAPS